MSNITATGKGLKITAGYVLWTNTHTIVGTDRIIPHCVLSDISLLYENIGITPSTGLYDVAALCCATQINKHSLIKPFYTTHPDYTPSDMPNRIIDGVDTLPYGYRVPYTDKAGQSYQSDVLNVLKTEWPFLAPQKDDKTCWKSLAHFHGYYHNAPAPIFPISTISKTKGANSSVDISLSFSNNDSRNVHPSNFALATQVPGDGSSFSDLRLNVAIFRNNVFVGCGRSEVSPVTGSSEYKDTDVIVVPLSISIANSTNDITLTAIPFYTHKSSVSGQGAFLNGVRKFSAMLTQDKKEYTYTIPGFSWSFTNLNLVKSSTSLYRLTLDVEIEKGEGNVTVNLNYAKARIVQQSTTDVGGTLVKYEDVEIEIPYTGTEVTTKQVQLSTSTGPTSVSLQSTNQYYLPSGRYEVSIFYNGVDKSGSLWITIP